MSIVKQIIKKLPEGFEAKGEIKLKHLKTNSRVRNKKIAKSKDITTCEIIGEKYICSEKMSSKKVKGYVRADDGDYYRITTSRFNILPFSAVIFFLKNTVIVNTVVAAIGLIVITTGSIKIKQNLDDYYKEEPTIIEVSTENDTDHYPEEETENPSKDDYIYDGVVSDYTGDELDSLEDTTEEQEENYTIIDGIIYQGDCLIINKNTAIPLGNNPENAKTGVSLEFIIENNNKVIFKSPQLKPGTGVNFVPSEYLSEGEHNLHLIINVYHENGMQDIGYTQDINIKIVK